MIAIAFKKLERPPDACARKAFIQMIAVYCISSFIAAAAWGRDESWQRLNVEIMALTRQGNYSQAAEVTKKVVTLAKKTFGADHPKVAKSLHNLATLDRILGRYEAAERNYKRALKIRENALGAADPAVANLLNNLAGLYRVQGRSRTAVSESVANQAEAAGSL